MGSQKLISYEIKLKNLISKHKMVCRVPYLENRNPSVYDHLLCESVRLIVLLETRRNLKYGRMLAVHGVELFLVG